MRAIAFSPDGRWLLSNGSRLVAWDLTAPVAVPPTADAAADRIRSVIVDSKGVAGRPFVGFSQDGSVLAANQGVWFVPAVLDETSFDQSKKRAIDSVRAISPDGRRVVTSASSVWQVSAQEVREIARAGLGYTENIAFGANGQWLVKGTDNIERWGLTDGAAAGLLQHDTAAIAVATGGRYVAVTDANGFVHIWTSGDWLKQRVLEVHKPANRWTASNVVFSPDRRVLAASSEDVLKVFSAEDWRELARTEHKAAIKYVVFSPDGRWLITLDGDNAKDEIITVTAMESPRTPSVAFDREAFSATVAISPEGRWVANKLVPFCSGSPRSVRTRLVPGFVRVWLIATGEQVASLPLGIESIPGGCAELDPSGADPLGPPSGNVELAKRALSWQTIPIETPRSQQVDGDGHWAALLDADSVTLTYDGGRAVSFPHFDTVYDMAFTADRTALVTTSVEGTARVWTLTREGMISASCTRLTRNLPTDEWTRSLRDEPYRPICPALPVPKE